MLLYFCFVERTLCGVTGNDVHENIKSGDELFQAESELILRTFKSKYQTYDKFFFFETQLETTQRGMYILR